jgi:DNA modification methylase
MKYQEFIESKAVVTQPVGINPGPINKILFPFQSDIVRWALRRGRAAIFADCGMGKTFMQLEWAKQIPGRVLIFCPLAVADQTIREGAKLGVKVKRVYQQSDVGDGISITNYDRLDKFDLSKFRGIVLDESSILKSIDGKTRTTLIKQCQDIPFRLACTATPAPNDFMELGNHAEFLGIMRQSEMLSMFFFHDGGETQKWALKGHAEDVFWKWVCSWSVMIRKPSDLGYDDNGFILPPMKMHEVMVRQENASEGMLFAMPAATLGERLSARRDSTNERAEALAGIVNKTPGQWMVWCNLNVESASAAKMIPGAVEILGSDKNEEKEQAVFDFISGRTRVLISKAKMTGLGVNLQMCSNVAYLGLSDSYEQFYQSVRRCYRFGQKKTVNVHIVIADTEGAVLLNIKRKEADAMEMAQNMVKHMKHISSGIIHGAAKNEKDEYKTAEKSGEGWRMILGDCVDSMRGLPDNKTHFSIFSPPYAQLYVYSSQDRDMGNARSYKEFFKHFIYLVEELYRVTMPGRIVAVDCMNIPAMKERDGYIGLKDFRGDLIRAFKRRGFVHHSEHCIWKDPLIEATRTKAIGLMHKQLMKDSSRCRAGIPQYLEGFRKPGENPEEIKHTNGLDEWAGANPPTEGNLSHERWRRYASPVWDDIRPGNTLNARIAREDKDEKHICPMALDIVARGIFLWSNPGDTVLSPFAGIGSEGYQAIKMGRKFLGVELKESYWRVACQNLMAAEKELTSGRLI